jgi:IS30 family transposase
MKQYRQLSYEERCILAFCMKRGESKVDIAKKLGRHPSTIYREVARNRTNHDDWYRAFIANSYAVARVKRERRGSHFTQNQWDEVTTLLKEDHSPEQVSGLLKIKGAFTISHETIYQFLLKDRAHGGQLFKHLRIKPRRRKNRAAKYHKREFYPDRRMISERPEAVENRSRIGHWEGDTVIGSDRHHCIVTLVERRSGYGIIKKIQARTVAETNRACLEAIQGHWWKFRSITFDNGIEFMGFKDLEAGSNIKCYFANPYHSWERGTNENFNGLVRQYLPKGSCMKHISQEDCDRIAEKLNSRPRKRHGFRTPKELFYDN